MTNENKNNAYYTGEASKLLRQVALASIAVIWLFKKSNSNAILPELKWPLILLVGALFIDFAQYFLGSYISHQNDSSGGEFTPGQDKLLNICFYAKILLGVIAVLQMITCLMITVF